ncbi:hypothetical protein XPA_007231 [Xanthoria parietina]
MRGRKGHPSFGRAGNHWTSLRALHEQRRLLETNHYQGTVLPEVTLARATDKGALFYLNSDLTLFAKSPDAQIRLRPRSLLHAPAVPQRLFASRLRLTCPQAEETTSKQDSGGDSHMSKNGRSGFSDYEGIRGSQELVYSW